MVSISSDAGDFSHYFADFYRSNVFDLLKKVFLSCYLSIFKEVPVMTSYAGTVERALKVEAATFAGEAVQRTIAVIAIKLICVPGKNLTNTVVFVCFFAYCSTSERILNLNVHYCAFYFRNWILLTFNSLFSSCL